MSNLRYYAIKYTSNKDQYDVVFLDRSKMDKCINGHFAIYNIFEDVGDMVYWLDSIDDNDISEQLEQYYKENGGK